MLNFLINEPKCVFIHIPKTGGTSIRKGFFEGDYKKAEGKIPFLWRKHFKFAFVRNPYTRFESCYKMFRYGMENTGWKTFSEEHSNLDMNTFIDIAEDDSIDIWSRKSIESKLRHHIVPQTHPANCLKYADFIGRYETLSEDFNEVCQKLGVKGELPKFNKSVSGSTEPFIFTDRAIQFIQSYYARDFHELGYQPKDIPSA